MMMVKYYINIKNRDAIVDGANLKAAIAGRASKG